MDLHDLETQLGCSILSYGIQLVLHQLSDWLLYQANNALSGQYRYQQILLIMRLINDALQKHVLAIQNAVRLQLVAL